MREQVSAFSPCGDQRRKSSIHSSRTDIETIKLRDPSVIQLISKETKRWVVCKSTENLRDCVIIRDQKSKDGFQICGTDKVINVKEEEKAMAEEEEGRLVEDEEEEEEEEGEIEEEEEEDGESGRDGENKEEEEDRTETDLNKKDRGDLGLMVLQWGHRKRPRCSRVDNHNSNNNHHHVTKSGVPDDQYSALRRKVVRMKKTEKAESSVKSFVKAKSVSNRVSSTMAEAQAQAGEGRGRVKTLRKASIEGSRAQLQSNPNPNAKHREKPLNNHIKTVILASDAATPPPTAADHNTKSDSPDRPNTSDLSASAKVKVDLPKIILSLSRREKEDDFFIIKGTKLPQRPKKRPKAIEKLLHYCTPGSWLTDLSLGRYDVREKKCVKKKPRGLKAMESVESDTE